MRMERELRRLGRNLDGLIEKTREAQAAASVKYAAQLKTLRAKQATAKSMLAQLRRRSAAASGPLKSGLVKAWAELSVAVNKARQRFRETP
jgi:peptidoglycan hydrolase CwlO-like protein